MKSKVYYIKEISSENILKLYKLLGVNLLGNVAVKIHSGEEGNQNYLGPVTFKDMIDYVNGTVVECNTAYEGQRNTTEKHIELMKNHGWDQFKFEILDDKGPDVVLDIPKGKIIKKNFVGKNILKYDSMLVLSHFKGHPMGGYGGALKQLSIGVASSYGKMYIHSAGSGRWEDIWSADHDEFLEAMADAASSVCRFFKGNMAFINVMKNMSVDCDCCEVAEDPCLQDMGIMASIDPVAVDQACIDMVLNSDDPGKEHFMERVNSRNGLHTIDCACELGCGSKEYELIEVK